MNEMGERTRLYLVRHGETTLSSEFRYIGHLDVDINENGVAQMYRLRERFEKKRIDALLCSDLRRSRKGAEIIGEPHGLLPLAYPEFREIHLGIWEGMTREEILERYPEEYQRRLEDLANSRIQGGESFKDLQVRVMTRLVLVLDEFRGKDILLIAHGGVNRVIVFDALQLDLQFLPRLDQSYGCVNIIDYYDDGPVVRLING